MVGGEDAVDAGAGLAGRRQHLLRLHRVDGRRGLGDLVNNPSKVNKQDLKLTNGSLRRAKQQNKQRDIERYINRDGRGFRIRTGRHSCRSSRRPERSSSSASGSSLRRLDSVYLRARFTPDGEEYKQEGRKEGRRTAALDGKQRDPLCPSTTVTTRQNRCHFFSSKSSTDPLIIIHSSTKRPLSITNRSLDHLETTTNTDTSRKSAVVLASPSQESGKAYRSRVCYSRQTKSRRATKATKDQRTRAVTIVKDETCRSEETDLKPHKQTPTRSLKNHRTENSTRPPSALDAPPARIAWGVPYSDF